MREFRARVIKYLEGFWWPRRIAISPKLYRIVSKEAGKEERSVGGLVSEAVLHSMEKNLFIV